jgi:parallel beta-helix repeat protein
LADNTIKLLFKDLTIQTAVNNYTIHTNELQPTQMEFDNCKILNTKDTSGSYCSYTDGETVTTGIVPIVRFINGSVVEKTGDGYAIRAFHGKVLIDKTSVVGGDDRSPIVFDSYTDEVRITNSDVTVNAVVSGTPDFSRPAIVLGADAATNLNPLGYVKVDHNRIRYSGAVASHAILLGAGVNYSQCTDNDISLPVEDSLANIGIVSKGIGNLIRGNVVLGERCIYLKGSQRNKVFNNTCIANGTVSNSNCLQMSNADASDCINNEIYNNIFSAANSKSPVRIEDFETPDNTTDKKQNYFNNNCYHTANADILYDATVATGYTLAEIQAFWDANSLWKDGDDNSITEDPQLDANYKPTNPLVIKGGKPDANGNTTSMGASPPPLPKEGVYGFQNSIYNS